MSIVAANGHTHTQITHSGQKCIEKREIVCTA